MRRLVKTRKQIQGQMNECLAEIRKNVTEHDTLSPAIDRYVNYYEQVTQLMFSANILHKGLAYAVRTQGHIIKLFYKKFVDQLLTRSFEFFIQKNILDKLRNRKKRLLTHAKKDLRDEGATTFYQLTGGNRHKYKKVRKKIQTIYTEIEAESQKNLSLYLYEHCQNIIKRMKEEKEYQKWRLKSYIWH